MSGTLGANHGNVKAVAAWTGQLLAQGFVNAGEFGGMRQSDVADTVRAKGGDTGHGGETLLAFGGNNTAGPIDVSTALNACKTAAGRQDFESETFITTEVAATLRVPSHGATWRGDGCDNLVAHTLRAGGFDASEDGTGRGTPLVITPTLTSDGDAHSGFRDAAGLVPIPFDTTQLTSKANRSNPQAGDPCHPLAAGAHLPAIAGMAVRRLTPKECERLQGFPDDFTVAPYRSNKSPADGPRYRALGNSMAVPVLAWIGRQISLFH